MKTAENVMTREPAVCTPDDSAVECARLMAREDVGFIPVVESRDTRKLVGVVTDRDLCLNVIAEGRDPNTTKVEELMTEEVISIRPEENLDRVLELMRKHQLHRICAIDENQAILGVIALADIAQAA